jgi:hypothetical protein
LFRRLFSDPPPLATSALVLAEGHGWFLRRYDQRRALEFLNFVDALPALAIEGFDANAVKRSSKLLKKFSDQTLTLMQKEYAYPLIANRMSPKEWLEAGKPDLVERATAKKREILSTYYPDYLPRDIDNGLRQHHDIKLPRQMMEPGDPRWVRAG